MQDRDGGLRLLVCDDSMGFRALVAAWFADDPQIEVAGTAASAAQLLDALDSEPDVVLLDRLLPDARPGRDLAAEVKELRPACAVVLISGMPADVLEQEAAATAADAFASKATTFDQLRAVILDATRNGSGPAPAARSRAD